MPTPLLRIFQWMNADVREMREKGFSDPEFVILRQGPGGIAIESYPSDKVDIPKTVAWFNTILNEKPDKTDG